MITATSPSRKLLYWIVCFALVGADCSSKLVTHSADCGGYQDWKVSPYILPFSPGQKCMVMQGNCSPAKSPWTHFGKLKYAYDFAMPIGTPIVAARSGTVLFVRDEFTDNDHGKNQGNAIVLLQEDGTYSLYAHITNRGSRVKVGQIIKQGDTIAVSGNSGESPAPHLHFQVNACGDFTKCESLPVTFRNASPDSRRLDQGSEYDAIKEDAVP
jgi:murein DD-endopeptidase MepM/ murein hydrolase activator NlpD